MPVSGHTRRYYDLPDDQPLQLVHSKRDCPKNISIFNLILALRGWRPSIYLGYFRTYVCDILRPQKLDDFPTFGEVEITKKELNRTSDK